MKAILKKGLALTLAVTLCVTQTILPVVALGEGESPVPVTTSDTVSLPTAPGGGAEQVDVDVTITTDSQGNTTAVMETASGGDTTDSGIIARVQSEVTIDAAGNVIAEDTDYTAQDAENIYRAQGGKETATEVKPGEAAQGTGADVKDVEVGLMKDGKLEENAVGTAEISSVTTPTNPGDALKSEDPANYDQTTVTNQRKVDAEITDPVVTTGDPQYLDENGAPLPDTEDGYGYYGGNSAGSSGYLVGWYILTTDENGNEVKVGVDSGTVTEWKTKEEATGKVIDGLYCVDASITTKPYGSYRLSNLEDAVEEGYYTEEEAKHLRAIATLGYTWDSVNNKDNVDEMNKLLREAGILSDGEALTSQQAATITQAAIWKFGNRYDADYGLGSDQLQMEVMVKVYDEVQKKNVWVSPDETESVLMMKAYEYLIAQTMEAPAEETQIINEEKSFDTINLVVGEKAENAAENLDADDTNDVYNSTIEFSLVNTPDKDNDNLIVKIFDKLGQLLKSVRIAGENAEGEIYEQAETVEREGKLFYLLKNLFLQENTDNTFSLQLEGTQQVKEGVYVFEAKSMTEEEMYAAYAAYAKTTPEAIKEMCKGYSRETIEQLMRSQNFITTASGTAQVDVTAQFDMSFNVEENVVTTTREWRAEEYVAPDPAPIDGDDGGQDIDDEPVPQGPQPRFGVYRRGAETIIPDEEVPLAAAPKTGDASAVMAAMSLASLAGLLVVSRKKTRYEQ